MLIQKFVSQTLYKYLIKIDIMYINIVKSKVK
jgi:hypothetical protein